MLTVTKKKKSFSSFPLRPGVSISFEPQPDGNCQFSAVSHLLQAQLGIMMSPSDLRHRVVSFLSNDPRLRDGKTLTPFVGDVHRYLSRMSAAGTSGDQVTLLGMASMLQVQFVVLTSLGEAGTQVICPLDSHSSSIVPDLPVLLLGYFAETELVTSEHYISLQAEDNDILHSILQLLPTSTAFVTSCSQTNHQADANEQMNASVHSSADIINTDADTCRNSTDTRGTDVHLEPNQPRNISFPVITISGQKRQFQAKWLV